MYVCTSEIVLRISLRVRSITTINVFKYVSKVRTQNSLIKWHLYKVQVNITTRDRTVSFVDKRYGVAICYATTTIQITSESSCYARANTNVVRYNNSSLISYKF